MPFERDLGDLALHSFVPILPDDGEPFYGYPPYDPSFNIGVATGSSVTRDPARDIGAVAAQADGEQKRLDPVREQSPVQPIRQPQNVANGALAVPATNAQPASLTLIPGSLQMGVIRHLMLNLSGLLSTTAGNAITIQLVNSYGQIYFSTVVVTTTAAVAIGALWDFADIYVPFTQGLSLVILSGGGSIGNAGEASVNVIWEA